jgi:hypothetical protein
MARARNIKPSIMDNEELAELDPITRLLFIYLWMLADREGRLEDRPKRIAAQALAYDRTADVDAMLESLQRSGFITRYTAAGVACIQITNFIKHQAPHGTEKDGSLPDKNGMVTKHKRGKNGYASGEVELVNCALTVKPQSDNALIPDSGFLIPDSLIPDSLSSQAVLTETDIENIETSDDDKKPKDPSEWIVVFSKQHGVDVDHRNFHDRKKFWPLAAAWTNAGVTVGQMRAACIKANAEATEPIAWLPAYADRVLASMQSRQTRQQNQPQAESFRERDDRLARERIESICPAIAAKAPRSRNVIDITGTLTETIGAIA